MSSPRPLLAELSTKVSVEERQKCIKHESIKTLIETLRLARSIADTILMEIAIREAVMQVRERRAPTDTDKEE